MVYIACRLIYASAKCGQKNKKKHPRRPPKNLGAISLVSSCISYTYIIHWQATLVPASFKSLSCLGPRLHGFVLVFGIYPFFLFVFVV